jgi:hypothetical protein
MSVKHYFYFPLIYCQFFLLSSFLDYKGAFTFVNIGYWLLEGGLYYVSIAFPMILGILLLSDLLCLIKINNTARKYRFVFYNSFFLAVIIIFFVLSCNINNNMVYYSDMEKYSDVKYCSDIMLYIALPCFVNNILYLKLNK